MPTGARRCSSIYAVCMVPDVCVTPVGAAKVPVPYPIFATLEGATKVVESVRFNKRPVYVFDHSLAPEVTGNEAGVRDFPGCARNPRLPPQGQGGIKSGVNIGKVWARQSSSNVRAEGHKIVRVFDEVWMNCKAD